MARIVASTNSLWVGKELYPGEKYISFDKTVFNHPTSKIVVPTLSELRNDIADVLAVQITENTRDEVISLLALQLCHTRYGCIYCSDWKAPNGVRKVLDAPVIND